MGQPLSARHHAPALAIQDRTDDTTMVGSENHIGREPRRAIGAKGSTEGSVTRRSALADLRRRLASREATCAITRCDGRVSRGRIAGDQGFASATRTLELASQRRAIGT